MSVRSARRRWPAILVGLLWFAAGVADAAAIRECIYHGHADASGKLHAEAKAVSPGTEAAGHGSHGGHAHAPSDPQHPSHEHGGAPVVVAAGHDALVTSSHSCDHAAGPGYGTAARACEDGEQQDKCDCRLHCLEPATHHPTAPATRTSEGPSIPVVPVVRATPAEDEPRPLVLIPYFLPPSQAPPSS